MADISDYTGRITSEHNDKPKYMAMLQAVLQPMVDSINVTTGLPTDFDLDQAVGAQLDIVGLWVGISRNVNAPLSGVYFSLDVVGLGFDQGAWKGRYDPDTGVVSLDDDTYRTLIRAKIGANRWDGTLGQSKEIMDLVFSGDTHVFIEDRQDMTIVLGISGEIPSAVFLALLTGGYIPIKPEGVQMSVYVVTSVSGSAIFGFDMGNEYVAGFDKGAWGGSPSNVVYPQALSFDFTSGALDSLINFTRASTATRFNASGVMETVLANAPRFDYDPVTHAAKGMLVEEARTNLVLRSSEFDNAAWSKARTTVTANAALAPDGTTAMDLVIPTTTSGNHQVSESVSAQPSTTYTMSFYAKAGGYNFVRLRIADNVAFIVDMLVDLVNGTISNPSSTAKLESVGNGVWRLSLSATTAATASTISIGLWVYNNSGVAEFAGDGVSGVYAWGAQIEAGNGVSSHIPTAASAVIRAADVAFVPISTWFNNLEGSLQASYSANNPSQASRAATLYSSASQIVAIDSNGQCEVGGAFASPAASGSSAAVAFAAGDVAAAVSGALTATGAPASLPDYPKGLYLGSLDGQSQFLNGWLKQVQYLPSRVSNADLIALTS